MSKRDLKIRKFNYVDPREKRFNIADAREEYGSAFMREVEFTPVIDSHEEFLEHF